MGVQTARSGYTAGAARDKGTHSHVGSGDEPVRHPTCIRLASCNESCFLNFCATSDPGPSYRSDIVLHATNIEWKLQGEWL